MKNWYSCGVVIILCAMFFGCGQSKTEDQPWLPEGDPKINYLRSLPYVDGTSASHDDPAGVILYNQEKTCPGFRLYTVQMLGRADLITEAGDIVHSWQYKPNQQWERVELLPAGDLLVIGIDLGENTDKNPKHAIPDTSRYVMRLEWSGKLLWKKNLPAHHDIELTPDGRLLLLTFNRRLIPDIHPQIMTRDECLTVIDQDGTVLESRSVLDAIKRSPGAFPLFPAEPSTQGVQPWIDLFHANSIEWMHHSHLFSKHAIYAQDNVLVCFRHQNRIAIVNWTENKIIWSWGKNQINGPHDAQVLENGNILLFDNGLGKGRSRAIELDPLTEKIVWQYQSQPPTNFYTASKGSSQRLPNGNTLLAESDRGQAIEVTPGGEIVWKFVCPHRLGDGRRAAIVRMIWHSREFIEALMGSKKITHHAPAT